jgi:hypothetical protein
VRVSVPKILPLIEVSEVSVVAPLRPIHPLPGPFRRASRTGRRCRAVGRLEVVP